MEITQGARFILQQLQKNGHEAYVVGGAVRNFILGIAQSDYDFTTSATPEEILGVFRNERTFAPGIRHGTVCVVREGVTYEITAFRTDGEYEDNRHPSGVTFVRSLREDLLRRDFTVNAICFDGESIVDPLGGAEDCRRGVIRAIGDPIRRFEEDALRILRALRFASKLHFKIDDDTKKAIFARKRLLNNISVERIAAELNGILLGDGCGDVLLEYAEVFAEIIPELAPCVGFDQKNPHHVHDVYTHSALCVPLVRPELSLRLAALVHDIAKPATFSVDEKGVGHFYSHARRGEIVARQALTRLKYPTAVRDEVCALVRYHDYPVVPPESPDDDKYLLRTLNKLGEGTLRRVLDLKRADNSTKSPSAAARLGEIDGLEARLNALVAGGACFDLRSLAVNGNDMLSLGFEGREVGEKLDMLLSLVMDGRLKNDRDTLMEYAKTL